MANYHLGAVLISFPSKERWNSLSQRYRKWEKEHANTTENKAPCSFLSQCSDEVQQQKNPNTSPKKSPTQNAPPKI